MVLVRRSEVLCWNYLLRYELQAVQRPQIHCAALQCVEMAKLG